MSKLIAVLLAVIAVSSVYSAHNRLIDSQPATAVKNLPGQTLQADSTQTRQLEAQTRQLEAMNRKLEKLEQSLVAVKQSLQSEQASTLALQREVLDLQEKLVPTGQSAGSIAVNPAAPQAGPEQGAVMQNEADSSHAGNSWFRDLANPLEPSAVNLVAAGADPDTAKDIQRRIDEYTLAELDSRDTAAREGWLRSEDFAVRQEALLPPEVDLKTELGEQGWDRFLYLQGRSNRVRIESVINGSAAAGAGIEAGDLLLVYAAEKIYTVSELQDATRSGQRGEVVTVRLDRQGAIIDTTINRGPLGVMLGVERVSPGTETQDP